MSIDVWKAAMSQIFFSIGMGYGVYIAFASFTPTKNNCINDCLIVSSVNSLTSLLAAFIVFSVLGFKAKVNEAECLSRFVPLLSDLTNCNCSNPRLSCIFCSKIDHFLTVIEPHCNRIIQFIIFQPLRQRNLSILHV